MPILQGAQKQNHAKPPSEYLEDQLAGQVGLRHSLIVKSFKDAVSITLAACGIGEGEPVLCSALEHPDILSAIESSGVVPALVDINPNTMNIDPYCLGIVIHKHKREQKPLPKALLASDIFGLPFNYAPISAMCGENGISLIENMSGAFGASAIDIPVGHAARFSIADVFDSLFTDNSGREAIIFCDDENDYRNIIRLCPSQPLTYSEEEAAAENDKFFVVCSLIRHTVASFTEYIETRVKIASWYRENLRGHVRMQEIPEGFVSSCPCFAILAKNEAQRANILEALALEKVERFTYDMKPPCGEIPECRRIALVNAQNVSSRLIFLPVSPYMCRNIVDHICELILNTVKTGDKNFAQNAFF